MSLSILLLLAAQGAGDMKPGLHERIPCGNILKWTWNVYVPQTYADEPDRKFPVVWCSTAAKEASFMGLESWADQNGFLLISFNSTNGEMTHGEIAQVQDLVVAGAEERLRMHPCLRFSTGAGAGASMSLLLASRHSERHAGVVLQLQEADIPVPKHIAVSFLCNETARKSFETVKRQGNLVRWTTVAGGRKAVSAPLKLITRDLDWMYLYQKMTHPALPTAEKEAMKKEVTERIAGCGKIGNPKKRLAEAEKLMGLPGVERRRDYRQLLLAWFQAGVEMAGSKDPAEEHEDLVFLLDDARVRKVPSAEVSKAKKRLEELRKDTKIRPEWAALKLYLAAKKAEEAAGDDPRRKPKVVAAYRVIAAGYPSTRAGRRAAEDVERLVAPDVGKKR